METTEMTFKKIGYSSENGKKKLSVITDKGQNIKIEVWGSFNPEKYPDDLWYSAQIKVKQGDRTTFYDLKVLDGQEPLTPVNAPSNASYVSKSDAGYDKRMALQYAVQTFAAPHLYEVLNSESSDTLNTTVPERVIELADKYHKWLVAPKEPKV